MKILLIKDGLVENAVVAGEGWTPLDGYQAIEVEDDDPAGPGWSFDGTVLLAPPVVEPERPPVDSLTRRQFFLQLELSGLTEKVAVWVASQPKLLQIAFNESGSFRMSEPAMQAGFAALGFTSEQITAFFESGSKL